MQRGTIREFDDVRGFGFITADWPDSEYFFHRTGLAEGRQTIAPGARVVFDVGNGPKGEQAVNVVEYS
jgi:CspA family cold shock protein